MIATRVSSRFLTLAIVALAGSVIPASAQTPPLMRFSDTAGNVITVDSTGTVFTSGSCTSATCSGTGSVGKPTPGAIGFSGTLGGFNILGAQGQTNKGLNNEIDLGLGTVLSSNGGQLTALLTVPNTSITGPLNFSVQTSGGTSVNSVYIDPNNGLFTTSGTPVAQLTLNGGNGNSCPTSANCIAFTASTAASSVTELAVIQIPAGGSYADDLAFFATSIQGAPLKVTCATSTGTYNAPYSSSIVATGGFSPYTFSITAGALPTGLTLNPSSGAIAGTITAFGTFSYTVKVVDGASGSAQSTGTSSCGITVAPPPISSTCAAITAVQGSSIGSIQLSASGGTGTGYSFLATGLPSGITLTSAGVLSGTPTVSGKFPYTVTITDSGGNKGTLSCSVTVSTAPAANCVSITATQGIPITPVTLTGTGGSGGFYTFSATGLPNGLTISQSGTISGTPLANGTFSYTVTITDNAGHKGTSNCSVTVTPPSITSSCVSISAIQNVAIAPVTLTGSGGAGGPYTFTASGLPAGLSISSNGAISGTPTVSGTFAYTVTITDKSGNKGTLNCSVTVSNPCLTLLCPKSSGFVGQTYSSWLVGSGGKAGYTYSITSGTLPAGLTLNASTGAITGKPTAEGTFTFTSKAVDSGVGSQQSTITSTCSITITKCGTSLVSSTNNWNSSNQWNKWGWGGWGDNSGKNAPISWFNCHMNKLSGTIPTTTFSVYISGGKISFGSQSIGVPDGVITFSTAASAETTVFNSALNRWETTLPIADASKADEIFASGVAYQMPNNQNINNVTWAANVTSSAPNVYVSWQFGVSNWTPANNGTSFPTLSKSSFQPDYNGLQVHPCHNGVGQSKNKDDNWGWGGWGDSSEDHAGSPQFNNRGNCLLDGGTERGDNDWCGSGNWNSPTPAVCACQEANTPAGNGDAGTISFWGGSNGQNLIKGLNGGNRSSTLANWLADNFPSTYGNKCNNNLHGKSNDDIASLCQSNKNQGSTTDNEHLACALSAYVTNTTLCGKTAPEYQYKCPVNGGGGGGSGDDGKGYGFNCDPDGSSSKYCDVHQTGWSCSNLGFHDEEPKTVIQLLQQCDSAKGDGSYNSNAYHDVFNKINSSGGIWQ
jgi:hypothetical protein